MEVVVVGVRQTCIAALIYIHHFQALRGKRVCVHVHVCVCVVRYIAVERVCI